MTITLRAWPFEVKPEDADDEDGGADEYYYAGWSYELVVDSRVYVLSRDRDKPTQMDVHGTQDVPTPTQATSPSEAFAEVRRILGGVPYDDPVFVKASSWLLQQPGVERVRVFTSDPEHPDDPFVPVDPDCLTEPGRTAALKRRRLLERSKVQALTDDSFHTVVSGSEKPILVNFYALWESQSKTLAPVLDEIADTHGDRLAIAKLNIAEYPTTPAAYKVTQLPTMIVFVDGEPQKRIVGARPKSAMLLELADYL